jgi:hypothetical protein
MEDETVTLSSFTDEHPEIFKIYTIRCIYDQISSFECSFVFFPFIEIKVMRNRTTPKFDA